MSWKTEQFQDESHKLRAQLARNNGHGKAHSSWDAAAAAQKRARREREQDMTPAEMEVAELSLLVKRMLSHITAKPLTREVRQAMRELAAEMDVTSQSEGHVTSGECPTCIARRKAQAARTRKHRNRMAATPCDNSIPF